MNGIPANPSQSFIDRNPHLYGRPAGVESADLGRQAGQRVRQSSKPAMNKLEQEWFDIVSGIQWHHGPRAQAVRFRLCNGVTYTPDVFAATWQEAGRPTAWEVKGKHAWDDAIVKIKMAAHEWPEIDWWLVWKENGVWKTQRILP